MNFHEGSNRLGLGLESCGDGTEKVVGIDPIGRVARTTEISIGCVVLKIDGQPATLAKADLTAGTRTLPTSEISITILWPGESDPVTVIMPALGDSQSEQAESTSAPPESDALSLEQIVAASFVKPPNDPQPFTAPPIAPSSAPLPALGADLKRSPQPAPRLALRDIPLDQIMAAPEETPEQRAQREWDVFQVWRLNNLGEPGNALGPGRASACGGLYDPFHDL